MGRLEANLVRKKYRDRRALEQVHMLVLGVNYRSAGKVLKYPGQPESPIGLLVRLHAYRTRNRYTTRLPGLGSDH